MIDVEMVVMIKRRIIHVKSFNRFHHIFEIVQKFIKFLFI